MTVFEKLKLQEAYQKVLNESWGDIINAGYSSMAMGSPFAPRPYRPGTNELKSPKELQQEQKNSAIAGAVGLAAGAAVVNPAAAATLGKYALKGLNAYSNYELLNDLSNDLPTATTAAGAMAILKPQKAANIAQRVLNSRWGWIPGVAYPVTRAFVDGYYNGDDSQPSTNRQPTSNANKQRTSAQTATQPPVQKTSQSNISDMKVPGYNDYSFGNLNDDIKNAEGTIPPEGTGSVARVVGDLPTEMFNTEKTAELYKLLKTARGD